MGDTDLFQTPSELILEKERSELCFGLGGGSGLCLGEGCRSSDEEVLAFGEWLNCGGVLGEWWRGGVPLASTSSRRVLSSSVVRDSWLEMLENREEKAGECGWSSSSSETCDSVNSEVGGDSGWFPEWEFGVTGSRLEVLSL